MCDQPAKDHTATTADRVRWLRRPCARKLAAVLIVAVVSAVLPSASGDGRCHARVCDVYVSRATTQDVAAGADVVESALPTLARWAAAGCIAVALPAGPAVALGAGVVCAAATLQGVGPVLDTVRTAADHDQCLRVRVLGHTPVIM